MATIQYAKETKLVKKCKLKILELELTIEKPKQNIEVYLRDSLTWLKMRKDFELRLSELLTSDIQFNVHLADVNGLHKVNRELGFAEGDNLIKRVANNLSTTSNSLVCRIGGDEFTLITIDDQKFDCTNEYVIATINSKNYKSQIELFNKLDKILIKKRINYTMDQVKIEGVSICIDL